MSTHTNKMGGYSIANTYKNGRLQHCQHLQKKGSYSIANTYKKGKFQRCQQTNYQLAFQSIFQCP